ncbi:MAG: hypothetical protein RJB01_620 [Actinomycetota bacterium]|jgi:hypothetical protein
MRYPTVLALAVIAGLQGIAVIAYAVANIIWLVGAWGEPGVSALTLSVQVLVIAAVGVGLGLIARGFVKAARWARAPFVVAQLLAVVVALPFALTAGGAQAWSGLIIASAILGLLLVFLPGTTRALNGDPAN